MGIRDVECTLAIRAPKERPNREALRKPGDLMKTTTAPWVMFWPDPPRSGSVVTIRIGGGAPIYAQVTVDGVEVGAADVPDSHLGFSVYLPPSTAGALLIVDAQVGNRSFRIARHVL